MGRGQRGGIKTGKIESSQEVKERVAELKNGEAAREHEIDNEILNYGRNGMTTMMFMLYYWVLENEPTPKR